MGTPGRDGPSVPGRGTSAAVRELLERHGLSADKSFGQHYLVSERVIKKIVSFASGAAGVLEIGPGVGILTAPLSEASTELVAVELDKRLLDALAEYAPKAAVVQGDVLKTDISKILKRLPEPRSVVSNMPYNITGPLITKIASCRSLFNNAVLMMQREVGDRVVAKHGTRERGSLSVFLQLQFKITKVCEAAPGCFLPPPKVSSIVLDFVPRDVEINERVFEIVRLGFTQPRKTLVNNLGKEYTKGLVVDALTEINLLDNIRPHQLTNKQWVELEAAL